MKNGAYIIIVALVFAVAFGITIGKLQSKYPANMGREAPSSLASIQTTPVKQIMSIRETQTALNAIGHSRYKCKVDGKWGPETAKALENFICDRNYKESTYD